MADTPSDAASDAGEFDPYHKWLGIPPKEQPPNHYRLLGIEAFEDDVDVIESAANRQSAFLRQLALGPHMEASQQLLNQVAKAQVVLLRPEKKAKYDEKLRRKMAESQPEEASGASGTDGSAATPAAAEVQPTGPSAVDRLKESGQQAVERFRQLPKGLRIGGPVAVAVLVLLVLFWPGSIDPDGPARFRVEVDDAFTTKFENHFVFYTIDEDEVAFDALQDGIELEGGQHTLEVMVTRRPEVEEGEEPPVRPEKLPRDASTVLKANFPLVATEPPTMQLSVAENGNVSQSLLLALSDEPFELPGGLSGEAISLQGDEKEYFQKVRPSATGRYLLTQGSGGLRLWNLEAKRTIRRLRVSGYGYCLALSPDGMSVLMDGASNSVQVVSMETGKPIHALEGHTGPTMSAAFSPDGTSAATTGGQGDGSVRLWDLLTGTERWVFQRGGRDARNVQFSPDGSSVYAYVDGVMVRLAADSGQLLTQYDVIPPYAPTGDNLGLLAKGINNNYQIWHAEQGVKAHEFELRSVGALALSPNGQYAASVVPGKEGTNIQLWNTTTGEEAAVFEGHTSDVYEIQFFASGNHLVSASRDGTCRVWALPELDPPPVGDPAATPAPSQPEPGDRLRQIPHVQNVAAASADGQRVASIYYGGAKVWDSTTGQLVFKSIAHNAEHIALSQDGRTVVTATAVSLHVWDVDKGSLAKRIDLHGTSARSLSLAPDNQTALVSLRMNATGPITPVLIDLVTGGEVGRFPESSAPAVLTPDGKHVVAIDDTIIRVYDSTGDLVQSLEGHEPWDRGAAILAPVAVSANGQVIASVGNADRKLRVWGIDGSTIAALDLSTSVSRIAVSPDGGYVYANLGGGLTAFHVESGAPTSLADGKAQVGWITAINSPLQDVRRLLTIEEGQLTVRRVRDPLSDTLTTELPQPVALDFAAWHGPLREFTAHERGVRHIAFSQDSGTLLTASAYDRLLRLWDAETLEEQQAVDAGEGPAVAAWLTDGAKSTVSIHSNGSIVETEIETRRTSRWSQKHDLNVTSFDVSPDGATLVSTAADSRSGIGNVALWDVKVGNQKWVYSLYNTGASSAGFSADGRHIVAGVDGIVRLFDVETGKPVAVYDGAGQVGTTNMLARFVPQQAGRLLTADAGALRLWDTVTGLEVLRYRGYSTQAPAVKTVVFSPDGEFFASLAPATPDLRIWKTNTGQQVAQMRVEAPVDCMAWSPDGARLALGHASGQVTLWHLPLRALTAAAFGISEAEAPVPADRLDASLPAGQTGEIRFSSSYAVRLDGTSDGKLLAAAHGSAAKVWNAQTGQLVFRSTSHGVSQVRISADGGRLLTGHRYGYELWDVLTGEQLGKHRISFTGLDLAPDGEHFAVASQEKKQGPKFELKNAATNEVVREFAVGDGATSGVWFSNSGRLVGVIAGEAVRVFDVASGDKVADLAGHGKGVYRFAFSDDETQLTSVAFNNVVRVWSLESGTELGRYSTGSQYVFPSGNGTCLAAIGPGLSLIDLEHEPTTDQPVPDDRPKTGTPIEIPGGHLNGARLQTVHFVPGGTHAITSVQDGTIRFWKLPEVGEE